MHIERFETVVIGGSQAGLSAGYQLRKAGRSFVILDANERVGDAWRNRYDSLRLFTPARYTGLPGFRFPARGSVMPTKDQMADYLETYAERFGLPVRTGIRVDRVWREGETYVVAAGETRFEAANVIVATGAHQEPLVPAIARELDPEIVQLHSSAYRNPGQLRAGGVLVVGAGQFGRRHRAGGRAHAPHVAFGSRAGPHPVRHRREVREDPRYPPGGLRGAARPDLADPAGPPGACGLHRSRQPVGAREAEAADRRRCPAGAQDGRRA